MVDIAKTISETALPSGNGVEAIPERAEAPGAQTAAPALFSLKGTTTIVTGGGRGLGQALSKGVVQAGGSVACLDLHTVPTNDNGEWDEIQQLAKKAGAVATYRVCNITDETAMMDTFKAIEQDSSDVVRGVVACAGIQQMVPAVDYPMDGFRKILEVKCVSLSPTPLVSS